MTTRQEHTETPQTRMDTGIEASSVNKSSRKKRVKRDLPRGIPYKDAWAVVTTPNIKTITGLRNRLVLELILRTGMRVSEPCSLRYSRKVKDIDPDDDWRIDIVGGKTGDRTLWLPPEMEDLMTMWLDKRPSGQWLFTTTRGNQLDRVYVYGMLHRMCDKANVPRTHPHALRHTFAHEWLRQGGNLAELRKILGHTTPAMSLRYGMAYDRDVKQALRGKTDGR